MNNFKLPSLTLTVMVAIPFIQLGYSYYISVVFGLFCYAFLISVKFYDKKMLFNLILVSILFLLKALINSAETSGSREILIPIRELLCFFAIIFISSKVERETINQNTLNKLIFILLVLLLILVTYQTYRLLAGQYFGFPVQYFVSNQATLSGVQDALFYQSRFRPTSFYGEPSYTAFIVLSLLITCYATLKTLKSKIIYTLLAFSIVVISQSLAGVLSVVFVIFFWLFFSKFSNIKMMKKSIFILIFIAVAVFGLYSSDQIYLRIANAFTGQDASSKIRISEPLSLLVDVISTGSIFGVNLGYIDKYLGYSSLDNALLRIFIYYGILMIIPMYIILIYAESGLLIAYIILTMGFNGELFSYDKALIVGMVIGLTKAKFINLPKNERYSSSVVATRHILVRHKN